MKFCGSFLEHVLVYGCLLFIKNVCKEPFSAAHMCSSLLMIPLERKQEIVFVMLSGLS